jgi:hypothetical protein
MQSVERIDQWIDQMRLIDRSIDLPTDRPHPPPEKKKKSNQMAWPCVCGMVEAGRSLPSFFFFSGCQGRLPPPPPSPKTHRDIIRLPQVRIGRGRGLSLSACRTDLIDGTTTPPPTNSERRTTKSVIMRNERERSQRLLFFLFVVPPPTTTPQMFSSRRIGPQFASVLDGSAAHGAPGAAVLLARVPLLGAIVKIQSSTFHQR